MAKDAKDLDTPSVCCLYSLQVLDQCYEEIYIKRGKIPLLLRGYLCANSWRVQNPPRVLYEISRFSMFYKKRDFTPFHVYLNP
jgi:hypothetical protein